MQTNSFGQVILSEQEAFDAIMQGYDCSRAVIDSYQDLNALVKNLEVTAWAEPLTGDSTNYHRERQTEWFIPSSYKDVDIESILLSAAESISVQALNRVKMELVEYKARNLIPLLQWLSYFRDSVEERGLFLGIGRGSSVASYVLYLLGIHCVNSLDYDLDFHEFMR